MALQVAQLEAWTTYLKQAGLQDEHAATYAENFVNNEMLPESATELDRDVLDELGVKSIGHALAIMKLAKKMKGKEDCKEGDYKTSINSTDPAIAAPRPLAAKPPQAKPPQAKSEMSKPEYRKFVVDWQVYKSISSTVQFKSSLSINATLS